MPFGTLKRSKGMSMGRACEDKDRGEREKMIRFEVQVAEDIG
jgi:hypothetical protein